ncbi:hypothetical protein GBAR_LOCUS26168 [Geodia barretti]|uniref:Uncharacterized protein n=1 Tax=Geodia barretti TaxID=519541 RepID=A0AA35TG66_GEOBA|nr:hypothetical protein GBAR_LOCUS26168 [Geodia barretti]
MAVGGSGSYDLLTAAGESRNTSVTSRRAQRELDIGLLGDWDEDKEEEKEAGVEERRKGGISKTPTPTAQSVLGGQTDLSKRQERKIAKPGVNISSHLAGRNNDERPISSLKKSAPKTYKSTAAVSDDDDLFNLLADEKEEKVKHRPKFRAKSQTPREKVELQKTPSEEPVDRPKSRKGPVKLPEKLPETITSALEPASGSREGSGANIRTLDGSGAEKKASALIKRDSNEATKRGKGRLSASSGFVVEEEDDLLSSMGLDDGKTKVLEYSETISSTVHETPAKSPVQEEVREHKKFI